ncbi:hypothetical protein GOP47_0029368 [Adiantum capillus-veneris]|nr:hypothetical protein GOP47_0029368 [Adiantum capillus-veneris]
MTAKVFMTMVLMAWLLAAAHTGECGRTAKLLLPGKEGVALERSPVGTCAKEGEKCFYSTDCCSELCSITLNTCVAAESSS